MITEDQRTSFILGAIYADGIDKLVSHHIPKVRKKLQKIGGNESNLYWFFMGVFAHIPPDTFAHAGKSRSFICAKGARHHFSELVIDSLAMMRYSPPYMAITNEILAGLDALNVRVLKSFRFLYPLVYSASKLPLYRLLTSVEQDMCPKVNFDVSLCTFVKHEEAMIQSLRESMPRINDSEFNDLRVQELSTRLVWDVGCCEMLPQNETQRNDQPLLDQFAPYVMDGS